MEDRKPDMSLGTPGPLQSVHCERRIYWSIIEGNGSQKPIALATRPQRGLTLGQHFNKTNSRDGFEFMSGKQVVSVKQIRAELPFKMHAVHDKT
jgi:hypothetical protein